MPQNIPLQQLPNQNFTITFDNVRYDITLRTIESGMMFSTVIRDGITLIQNTRCMPITGILPYRYLEAGYGNFYWDTNLEYPDYTKFGTTHFLLFMTGAELENLRNG